MATVVGTVAEGMSEEDILQAYPDLEREDCREALRYAAEAVQERELRDLKARRIPNPAKDNPGSGQYPCLE